MNAPYGKGYAGEIRINAPHPRSYGAEIPLSHTRPGNPERHLGPNSAHEMRAYCRVHGIPIPAGTPVLCKTIPKPSGSPVTGSPTFHLPGQLQAV